MRIACIHVPQLSLQCATRIDPTLRGAAIVVVGVLAGLRGAGGPVVLACSRAAFALGARVGMTGTTARAISSEIAVISADAQTERETVRALADALLAITPVVDVGGRVGAGGAHLAMYCEVPSKTRGTSFGERLIQQLEALGLTGRVGIADDRFTAWVAAAQVGASAGHHAGNLAAGRDSEDHDRVISVPRGGSAAFLAPRPLSLLSISSEVQHMLEALGVTTLGEFAALPAPSVTRAPSAFEADYQALARGEGGHNLRPYAPEAPIREDIIVAARAGAASGALRVAGEREAGPSLAAAVGLLAERVALRLAGRGRGAARLELAVTGPGGERIIPIVPVASARARTSLEALLVKPGESRLLSSSEAVADAISQALHDTDQVWRLRVTVTGEAIAGDQDAAEEVRDAIAEAEAPAIVDTLSVVLSNGGMLDLGLAFGPMPSGAPTAGVLRERRETHQRTRRHRRGRTAKREAASLIQPKLFKS
jgi:protein ImuB